MNASPASPERDPARLLQDRPGGDFLVHRDIYRDPEVFAWEMEHVFEGTWNLVGLASQLPRPYDFITTSIGRAPIIISRAGNGELHCLLNTCRHKGALVCHHEQGSARSFVCQYHGWAYACDGRNVLVNHRDAGAYGPAFDAHEHDHDLVPVARFANYRGLLFASLRADVPELDDYLGDLRPLIDLVIDQSPQGVECVGGRGVFVYEGNWKLQMENGVDPYHFASTHVSYIQSLQRRAEKTSVYSGFSSGELQRGSFAFAHGHNAMWGPAPAGKPTPLSFSLDEIRARVGEDRLRWMQHVRNITLFPNAQIADNAALQLRIWRPLSAERTEMRTFCLAPVGEPPQARRMRIRQYEEFFNPGGLATPDDIANYEDCQRGFGARTIDWQQGHARGATLMQAGANDAARELGIEPLSCVVGPFNLGDETVMHATYRTWLDLIQRGRQRAGSGA
ncbi:SRPBCC family protein [Ramlibacter sp. AN1015]|uniref:aromatic ring-hydroxylating oxygenase subunit alpha n=1 Tax=Ramlibacter sp. AN1015 TaxID=3133428 RepID=UPI0030C5C2A6